jgi:hypothetical protein
MPRATIQGVIGKFFRKNKDADEEGGAQGLDFGTFYYAKEVHA